MHIYVAKMYLSTAQYQSRSSSSSSAGMGISWGSSSGLFEGLSGMLVGSGAMEGGLMAFSGFSGSGRVGRVSSDYLVWEDSHLGSPLEWHYWCYLLELWRCY